MERFESHRLARRGRPILVTEAERQFRLQVGACIDRVGLDAFQPDPSSLDFSDYGLHLEDVVVATDPGGAARNFGAVLLPAAGDGLLAMHGTQTKEEWLRVDAWAIPKEITISEVATPLGQFETRPEFAVMVHLGMWNFYRTLRLASGRPLLETLIALGIRTVGGHSLAGPLATGLAAQIRALNLVMFASSKPGDRRLSDFVQRSVQNIWSVANPNDMVPRLPFTGAAPLDFQHVVPLEYLGPGNIPSDWENSHHISSYLELLRNTPTT